MDFPNGLISARAYTRRDIFVESSLVKKPETIDPRIDFPVLAGTVMARATDSKMLVRYVNGSTGGAEIPIGMLYDEVRQPGKILELGGAKQAMPCDLVIFGVAINATDIANLDADAREALAKLSIQTYIE